MRLRGRFNGRGEAIQSIEAVLRTDGNLVIPLWSWLELAAVGVPMPGLVRNSGFAVISYY